MPSIASRSIKPVGGEYPQLSGSANSNPAFPPAHATPLPVRPQLPNGGIGNQPQPIVSPILRCPLPAIWSTRYPDNLRQFYAGGVIPQYRFPPPSPL